MLVDILNFHLSTAEKPVWLNSDRPCLTQGFRGMKTVWFSGSQLGQFATPPTMSGGIWGCYQPLVGRGQVLLNILQCPGQPLKQNPALLPKTSMVWTPRNPGQVQPTPCSSSSHKDLLGETLFPLAVFSQKADWRCNNPLYKGFSYSHKEL